jgi:hypothetical protein
MPLSINVGLSRKASKDYQSTGVSINVTAELDQALLARPEQLQKQIGALYSQAHQALDGQMNRLSESGTANGARPAAKTAIANNGNGRCSAAMTASQRRAVLAIAKRWDINVDYECRERFATPFDDLSIREASDLIDHLKNCQPASDFRR